MLSGGGGKGVEVRVVYMCGLDGVCLVREDIKLAHEAASRDFIYWRVSWLVVGGMSGRFRGGWWNTVFISVFVYMPQLENRLDE